MTTFKLIVSALICLHMGTSASWAQQSTASIRAGEHPTYSRLVIPLATDLAWELRTFGRDATLMLPTDAISYLTDSVFDRIPRSRLSSLETETVAGDTFLRLQLLCDCDVSAKTEGRSLILDISDKDKDQPQPEQTQTTDTLARPTPRPESAEASAAQNQTTPPPSDLAERLLSQLNKAAEQGLIELNDPEPNAPATQDPTNETMNQALIEGTQPPESGLQPVEETLDGLEGVAERIEQGLIKTLGADDFASSVRIQIPEEFKIPETQDSRLANSAKRNADVDQQNQDHCIDDELLDVAYWADQRPYSEQVAVLQARVFGEFDEPDSDAILQLARFYIFFGLGTETTSLLKDLKLDQDQSDLLLELANTVEGKAHLSGGILDKAAGCPGAVALWRTAALDTSEEQPLSEPQNVIDLFSELPIHVRRIIGPRLIQSFITRGQNTAANQIFAIVDRAAGYHGDTHELRRADLLHLDGEFSAAETIYWKLVYENSDTSAQAAIRLVQSLLIRKAPLPPNVITALEALAFEFRGDPVGKDLLLTTIQAKAGSNNTEDAINISLQEIEANPTASLVYYDAIDTILSTASTAEMGASEYIELIFKNMETIYGQQLKDDTKFVIASELIDAGLPNSALDLVATMPDAETQAAILIAAKASLKLRNFDATLALHQANPDDPILAGFAARAQSSLGLHQDAIATAMGLNSDVQNPSLLWRGGNWDLASQSSTGPKKVLATFMANRQSSPTPNLELALTETEDAVTQTVPAQPDITLGYATDVQTQSATVRQFLENAISEM